jgi:acetyltransferase
MLEPKTVALIGATETPNSVGRTIMENLRSFGGTIYPVNLKRRSVLGIAAFAQIRDVPEPVDLAVIVTPAATVPDVVSECAQAGVKGAVIISAGFKECGPTGVELERRILARRGRMRVIGPNCLGVMSPANRLNATFAKAMARSGQIGFISQSGALCTAILDWGLRENVGFSAFLSIGSMLDVDWGDLIYYLGDDLATRSILIYMESIGNARSFLSAAREVAITKPIIVLKVGRTEAGAKAASSHTGTLTGADQVLDAAFRRAGVLRVDTVADLFDMAEVLAKQPRPSGPRLAIVTNAGGPGVLATDMLLSEGGQLASLADETVRELDAILPENWSRSNPVDLLGDATAARYLVALEAVSRDPGNDGVLAILTPQAMTAATAIAEQVSQLKQFPGKPILTSWMGAEEVAEGKAILNTAGIPTFEYPDTAARAFCYMWRYSDNLRALYETPLLATRPGEQSSSRARLAELIRSARREKRTLLTETESKQVLAAYDIPVVETHVAGSEDEAVSIATKLGTPVVLKLYSRVVTHKSDVGGVKLNLRTEEEIRTAYREIEAAARERQPGGMGIPAHERGTKAHDTTFLGVTVQRMHRVEGYELILGSSIDPQFGPVLLFGAGGQLVEVFNDSALGLPPLNATLARRLMERTRVYQALKGVRGRPPVNLAALEAALVRFSQLVAEQRWIKEIDVNPLHVSPAGVLALDARIVLHDPGLTEEKLPPLAIRPYPAQYVSRLSFRRHDSLVLRPIRPEDEPLMVKFHGTLSQESVYFRYFGHLSLEHRTSHERLTRICFNDYDREIAIVAVHKTADGEEIIGVGRLIKVHGANEAEFALVISDQWQGHGLGTHLLTVLLDIGRREGLDRIIGHILPENDDMQRVCRRLHFAIQYDSYTDDMRAEIDLNKTQKPAGRLASSP